MIKFLKDILIDVIIVGVALFVILQFASPAVVREESMQPNYYNDDYLLMEKISYMIGEPERGDVVIFESNELDENGDAKFLIKRVVGLPGETIEITQNGLYVDGELIPEDYVKDSISTTVDATATLGEGEYYVLGDNRVVSKDSRVFGAISEEAIVGRAFLRIFPFTDFGFTT